MAGIGFELRSLYRRTDSISALVGALGHAAVIAAGPWIFTIIGLALITLTVQPVIGFETLTNFRIVVIYSFATSLVTAAPVTIVATRLLADCLWLKRFGEVRGLLIGSYILSLAFVVPVTALLVWYFGMPGRLGLSLVAMSSMVSLIWVALSFAGAVRDYAGVTMSFGIGLLVAVLGSVGAAVQGFGAVGMAWGFLAGLTIIFFGLTERILSTFPQPLHAPLASLKALLSGMSQLRHLAIGALAGACAVWIDKWVFWFSPAGETVTAGLIHAPLYDSAMFIASLTLIPSLSIFIVKLETHFFESYQHYYGTIQGHGTYAEIEAARKGLATDTLDQLVLITVLQAGLCAVLLLLAPAIVDVLNLQFRQIAVLRYGALGAVFHFVLIAATSVLVFFDRRRVFLGLQVMFLVTNLTLTLVTIALGEDYYGIGYFLACLSTSYLAYRSARRTFADLNYLTFIGNNPSIRESTKVPGATDRSIDWRELLQSFLPRWKK